MAMALSTHRWTRADLERLPDDDGNRYEIIDGELLVTPAPRPAHGAIVTELGSALSACCRRIGLTVSTARPAIVTPDSHVEPDIVVRGRTVPPPDRWDDAPLPVLVVEVLSESTRRNDRIRKRRFYLEAGVPEYWIVDGDSRVVLVIDASGERAESRRLTWRPPGAQESVTIDLEKVFEEALGPPG